MGRPRGGTREENRDDCPRRNPRSSRNRVREKNLKGRVFRYLTAAPFGFPCVTCQPVEFPALIFAGTGSRCKYQGIETPGNHDKR